MARRKDPKLRHHKATGQAVVAIQGTQIYLGKFGTREAERRYHLVLSDPQAARAKWLKTHQKVDVDNPTIAHLLNRYRRHLRQYFGPDSQTPADIELALRPLEHLFGNTLVEVFGPLALRAVRDHLIGKGLARTTINGRINKIKTAFKWAASEELAPGGLSHALSTVSGLRAGRGGAKETQPVKPVPERDVWAVLPYLTLVVRDMVQLQWATGMRSGELCRMTPGEVDREGDVWVYRPAVHKTTHHGKERAIYLGPTSQSIVAPYLLRGDRVPCFSPTESEIRRRRRNHERRVIPIHQGNVPGSHQVDIPRTKPGDQYTAASYRRAIVRACDRAGVGQWHPHQIRHSHGTRVREQFGIEGAQVALGHSSANVTSVYAQKSDELALRVALALG
jgi:integrase